VDTLYLCRSLLFGRAENALRKRAGARLVARKSALMAKLPLVGRLALHSNNVARVERSRLRKLVADLLLDDVSPFQKNPLLPGPHKTPKPDDVEKRATPTNSCAKQPVPATHHARLRPPAPDNLLRLIDLEEGVSHNNRDFGLARAASGGIVLSQRAGAARAIAPLCAILLPVPLEMGATLLAAQLACLASHQCQTRVRPESALVLDALTGLS